jgi:hypothetical protein
MFASFSYFGRIVSDTADQNFENTGPYILGLGNYRYADYALTCPMLIADLLCCLRAPYKVTGALTIHVMLLSGVVANFYTGRSWTKGGMGPAIAWFCFSTFWYIVAFVALLYLVKRQYAKLARIAEKTEAKKALLPLRIAIVTIFTLWICYPIVWIVGDQGMGLISFSAVECIHAFCDIVAKSMYGFTLARFKSYYDKKLCQLLDLCGEDGEEMFLDVEESLRTEEFSKDNRRSYNCNEQTMVPFASSARRLYDSEVQREVPSASDATLSPLMQRLSFRARSQSPNRHSRSLSNRRLHESDYEYRPPPSPSSQPPWMQIAETGRATGRSHSPSRRTRSSSIRPLYQDGADSPREQSVGETGDLERRVEALLSSHSSQQLEVLEHKLKTIMSARSGVLPESI